MSYLVDQVLDTYFGRVMLEGMPEGTIFQHEVLAGSGLLHIWLATGDNVTEGQLHVHPLIENESFVAEVVAMCTEVQRRHFLATFNVWPGWRI